MADLEEITETPRTDINNDSRPEEDSDSTSRSSAKRKRSKRRRSSQSPAQISPSDQVFEDRRIENESGKQGVEQQADSPKEDKIPTQEDHRARFYESYRKVADEYDKDFLKKHDEDLNTTLIFAGLFSAVTSAFIIEVNSQLQSDPNDETAALLRVLIYKIDNTTFGNNAPSLPQWTGPPRAIVQVQAILFASLAVSLFSAFLAMLGKQWLNRYESIDMRGSAVERSHNRQRKLDGIIVWYFNHVMESLPLMLQAGLLLLGCALSRYLWEINIIVASVVLSVTSFGAAFYFFIIIAGTASESCPYQTPGAHFFRYILHRLRHRILPTLYSAVAVTPTVVSSNFSRIFQASQFCQLLFSWWTDLKLPWYSMTNFGYTLLLLPVLFVASIVDAFLIGRAVFRSLVAFTRAVYYQLIDTFGTPYSSFINASLQIPTLDRETILLDLRCISWILRTSLDKAVHLLAFRHLTSFPDLAHFHSTLVVDCFNVFVGCVSISNSKVVVRQGLEQLATEAANGFFSTLHHLASIDPASSAMEDLQRQYKEVFSPEIDFTALPFHSTMSKIHALAGRFGSPRDIRWPNRRPPVREYVPFAQNMVEAAQKKYVQTQDEKVPRRILRSALYFLTLGLLAPASVIADSLTVVAIDLGCDVSNVGMSDESVRVESISSLITAKLEAMVETRNSNSVLSKRKAINTLLPCAIFLEQDGCQGMINAISRAAMVSNLDYKNHGKFMWGQVVLYISRLFEKQSPTSLNRVITLISPYVPWEGVLNSPAAVARLAAAASAVPYTDEVGQNVVDTLYQIAVISLLRPHIPIDIWGFLKMQPPLPSMYQGIGNGGSKNVVAYLRGLGDIDLLKSNFLLVWTHMNLASPGQVHAMKRSLQEDFSGAEMKQHRKDLVNQLDRVLGQFGDRHRRAQRYYAELRDALLELDRQ